MSNATLAVYGRLGSDPREHATRTGNAMTTASLAVDVPDRTQGAEEGATETLWLRVTAFGRVAESLAWHAKGDPVSVCGRLQFSRWRTHEGETREQWAIVADVLVSARTARPGGRRKGDGAGNGRDRDDGRRRGEGWPGVTEPHPPASSPASSAPATDFDDDIPF